MYNNVKIIMYMTAYDVFAIKCPIQVHGGITEDDIVREVNKARELAKTNEKHGLETVMFFDEANTSEAIGLIKEIMCDNRIRGEPITEMIKFIAACNPYRK